MNLLLIPFKRIPILLYFLAFQCATFAQETIVIFAINDPHSEIENFAKIKPLIDAEKAIDAARFFPDGNRGVCRFVASASFGEMDKFKGDPVQIGPLLLAVAVGGAQQLMYIHILPIL